VTSATSGQKFLPLENGGWATRERRYEKVKPDEGKSERKKIQSNCSRSGGGGGKRSKESGEQGDQMGEGSAIGTGK